MRLAEPPEEARASYVNVSQAHLSQFAEQTLDDLCRRFPLGYRPQLEWRNYRVTAGMAYYERRAIGLSARILTDEVRLVGTLIHEYAHLLAFARHGRKGIGHGEPWRQAMRDLGQEPQVRHTYPVQRNQRRSEALYCCDRCGEQIACRRRLPKRRIYMHVKCGGVIRFSHTRLVEQAEV
jgi:predicted SprT family Zn-dependent metalloprotease